jgi:hypothetical protein
MNVETMNGNGVLLNSPSTTIVNVELNITLSNIMNVSAQGAVLGGLISIINTSQAIRISSTSSLF